MSDIAYVSVIADNGFAIGLARQGVRGYTPLPTHGTFTSSDAAEAYVKSLNATELGLKSLEAWKIVASTIRP
jgi:hypothetical protein